MRRLLFLLLISILLVPSVIATVQTEIFTMSSQWVVPDGVYFISIQMSGGGGAGNSGGVFYTTDCSTHLPKYGYMYAGGGGLAGTSASYSNIAVTPGQTVSITVGAGGSSLAGLAYQLPDASGSNIGYPSPTLTAYTGKPTSVAVNGTTYSVVGGYSGNITISSPGCGSVPALVSANNYISIGLDGMSPIAQYAGNGQNGPNLSLPYWQGSSGGYGYGAGGGGGGQGSMYSSPLGGGSSGHGAVGVVIITYNLDQYYSSVQYNTPHNVKFTVRSAWGGPVSGVLVNATYEESSGPWDWLQAWIGVLRNPRVDAQNVSMSGTTGYDGTIDFLMVESIQYNVSAYKTGAIDQYMFIYPKDDDYTIWVNGGLNQSLLYPDNCPNPLDVVQVSVSTPALNSTHGRINVTYTDKLLETTSSIIFINQSHNYGNITNETTIATFTSTDQNYTHSFDIANPADQSYLVHVNATTVDCGGILRDYGVTFPSNPINMGIPDILLPFIAMGIMIYVGLQFTRTQPGETVIGICAIGWITFLMHWWDQAVDPVIMGSVLAGFTVLAIIYNVALRSKKLPMQ